MHLHAKYRALLEHAHRAGHSNVDDLRLCFELLSVTEAIDADCASRLSAHGLSEGKFVILLLLGDAPDGLSPHRLAERAGVTRATTTGLLDGLERDGFVSRHGDVEDGRRITVRLTDKGRKAGHELTRDHTAWIADLFAGLAAESRDALRVSLRHVWSATDQGRRHGTQTEPDTP
jgi:DNA-binding MarR family transcriptional regulator